MVACKTSAPCTALWYGFGLYLARRRRPVARRSRARGAVATGEEFAIESILGRESVFYGRVARTETWAGRNAVIPEVRGSAHMTGSARFVLDDNDLIGRGFLVAR